MMIAQITDLHVRPRGKVAYERVDTNAMLEAAVATIEALPRKPDLVIATGDLTDCGLAAESLGRHHRLAGAQRGPSGDARPGGRRQRLELHHGAAGLPAASLVEGGRPRDARRAHPQI